MAHLFGIEAHNVLLTYAWEGLAYLPIVTFTIMGFPTGEKSIQSLMQSMPWDLWGSVLTSLVYLERVEFRIDNREAVSLVEHYLTSSNPTLFPEGILCVIYD